jgi:transcriptional regulator with XRE-family HTH domain
LNGLKLARLQAGWRQIDLAKAADVSESQVAKWETDRLKPSPEMVERLAGVLGVPGEAISRDYDLRALRTQEAVAQ